MEALFFENSSDLRQWFETHHATAQELWVGYYKKDSGKLSITWPESVDQALCFGWIDGIRKSIDGISYKIRFTPRKTRSTWSNVNINRIQKLMKADLVQPAGLKAFQQRKEEKSGIYAYEQKNQKLTDEYEQKLKANSQAWAFFQTQSAWYQRMASWWIISAKKEETQLKRLDQLISDSAQGQTIQQLTRTKPAK